MSYMLMPLNILITIYFWVMLYPIFSEFIEWGGMLEHGLPMVVCIVDHLLMHVYPCYPRQAIALVFTLLGYFIMMITATFEFGEPVYPMMDW